MVMKKKLVMWFCAQCSYVTIWEKKRSPLYFQICSQGRKWVKNVEGQGKGLFYSSPVGCVFSVLPPSGHMREWLVEKAKRGWPALPRQARYWVCKLLGKSSLPLPERHLPLSAVKQLIEILCISEMRHGLRRKRKRYFERKALNNHLLLSSACCRALGQLECKILRQKDVSEMQVGDLWKLTYLSV